jgi:hypothetical protein
MTNAKEEFLIHTKNLKVICAKIQIDKSDYGRGGNIYILKQNYTPEEYQKFLTDLDQEYDSGYGSQQLFGNVWCEDGIWLERHEYDGAENWEIKSYPQIDLSETMEREQW